MQRRRFFKAGGALAFSCLGSGLLARAQPTDHDDAKTARLDRSFRQVVPRLLDEAGVPGAAIGLVRNGKPIWTCGFGIKSSDADNPVDADTIFEAASVSKTVFAYAILKLCAKGTLDLDRPLTNYVPWRFLDGDPRLEQVTARHVLSHSGGFQDWRSGEKPLKIHFTPGEKFMYSGEGYFYLQSVLTHLAGRTDTRQCAQYEAGLEVCATDFDAYMKRSLLESFGMASSTYEWVEHLNNRMAPGHDVHRRPILKDPARGSDVARYGAAGGLLTSANDFAKFIAGIVTSKTEPDTVKERVRLTPSRLAQMTEPQIKLPAGELIDGAASWALGWGVQERKDGHVLVHSGGQSGFRSLAMVSPAKQSGFIVLTNSDHGGKLIYHPSTQDLLEQVFVL